MFLVVGLGNPGSEYEHTRHNSGFDVIDLLGQRLGARYWKNKGGALVAEVTLARGDTSGEEVLLAKPQSFMNLSGGPVSNLAKAYGVKPDHIIVIHDDLDLPLETIRVKFGGAHAGHNGLRSIIEKLQTRDFYRVKIGIGRPTRKDRVIDYVLSKPRKDDLEFYEVSFQKAAEAVESLIEKGLQVTQNQFN